MSKRVAFTLAVLTCTSAFGADEPQWLKEARARESKSLSLTEIRSKDGWFTARTPGKAVNTIEKVEGSYSVELDIGGDASVHCEVYPEGVDLANALRVTFENALENIGTSQGKLEARALEARDTGAYGAVPYLSLTWLYRVSTPEGARLGSLKQFVMEKGKQAVYCAHNDLGFTGTFAAITRAFAESLTTQEPASPPQYAEISTASMAGTKVGIAVITVERDAEGDTKVRQMTSMLIATDDGAVQAQDSSHVDWLRPDGTLINSADTEVSNGEITHSLSLSSEGGTWTVEGEVQGKAVKSTLPKDSTPGSSAAQARELRALMAGPDAVGREHSMGIWLAQDPDKLTVAKTKLLSKQGDKFFTARGEIGGIVATLLLDKSSGMAHEADIKMGPLALKLQRVYVKGSF